MHIVPPSGNLQEDGLLTARICTSARFPPTDFLSVWLQCSRQQQSGAPCVHLDVSLSISSRRKAIFCYNYLKQRGTRSSECICTEATVKVTYCWMAAGGAVVIDWRTKAEWFLSPSGIRRSLRSLFCIKKKIQVRQKRRAAFLTEVFMGHQNMRAAHFFILHLLLHQCWCETKRKRRSWTVLKPSFSDTCQWST